MTCKWNREYFEGKPKDLWCYQRKLNSLQLELVKSDNAILLQYFLCHFHLSKSQLVWILMIAINLEIENVIQINAHKMRSYFLCHNCTVSDIIHYTKLCKLARLEWMNKWLFICHAINRITGQSMDVKIIVARRPPGL